MRIKKLIGSAVNEVSPIAKTGIKKLKPKLRGALAPYIRTGAGYALSRTKGSVRGIANKAANTLGAGPRAMQVNKELKKAFKNKKR